MAPTTFNIRRTYLKSFFNFLLDEGVITENPIDFSRRRDEGRARNVPQEVLKNLLNTPDRKTYAGLRDYTLILFILDTGVRPGEALLLLPEDFNLDSCEVTIRAEIAKTRKKRTLPLSPLTASAIYRLKRSRPREWWDNSPFFCSEDGKPMRESSLTPPVQEIQRSNRQQNHHLRSAPLFCASLPAQWRQSFCPAAHHGARRPQHDEALPRLNPRGPQSGAPEELADQSAGREEGEEGVGRLDGKCN